MQCEFVREGNSVPVSGRWRVVMAAVLHRVLYPTMMWLESALGRKVCRWRSYRHMPYFFRA